MDVLDIKGFEEILSELDALASDLDDAEELEELNAELEDALMMLGELDPRDGDYDEDLEDALEELRALAGDYQRLAGAIPGVADLARRMETMAQRP